jgi:SAM-dependent methyltransferase
VPIENNTIEAGYDDGGMCFMDDLFFEIFTALPRQGPGLNASTVRAFSAIRDLPAKSRILDIGCGAGFHTLELARLTEGTITAMDNHRGFLSILEERAVKAGAVNIHCVEGDMLNLTFEPRTFDIIWAEGSIFIIGFEKGLLEWKKFLKPGGHVAVTELNWIKKNPPVEIFDFLNTEYPAIETQEENKKKISRAGYDLIECFTLPEDAWLLDYYGPMEKEIAACRIKYPENPDAQTLLDSLQKEIDMYRKYHEFYGYTFFIARGH